MVTNYLDDFLFLAITQFLCNWLLQHFLEIYEQIRVPISEDKTEKASLIIVFLGVLLNGKGQFLAVPEEKRLRALHKLRLMTSYRRAKVHDLQKLVDLLNFLKRAIFPGRAFTHRMYAKFTGFKNDLNKQQKERVLLKLHHHV